jgi:hypothetical protein
MVDIGKLKPAWFDHRTDIPQWICNRIAYAVVEWAVLERELEELIRILMDGEIQQVRILVNNMNARTRVQTAANLIQAHMVLKKLKRRARTRLNNLGKGSRQPRTIGTCWHMVFGASTRENGMSCGSDKADQLHNCVPPSNICPEPSYRSAN